MQIITHFGTYTENDDGYYKYDNYSQKYRIYNEIENVTYYYSLNGEIANIYDGNMLSPGGGRL